MLVNACFKTKVRVPADQIDTQVAEFCSDFGFDERAEEFQSRVDCDAWVFWFKKNVLQQKDAFPSLSSVISPKNEAQLEAESTAPECIVPALVLQLKMEAMKCFRWVNHQGYDYGTDKA